MILYIVYIYTSPSQAQPSPYQKVVKCSSVKKTVCSKKKKYDTFLQSPYQRPQLQSMDIIRGKSLLSSLRRLVTIIIMACYPIAYYQCWCTHDLLSGFYPKNVVFTLTYTVLLDVSPHSDGIAAVVFLSIQLSPCIHWTVHSATIVEIPSSERCA